MAKYDAMGDKVNRRVPIALWIMLLGVVVAAAGFIWCLNTDLKKYAKTEEKTVKAMEKTYQAITGNE